MKHQIYRVVAVRKTRAYTLQVTFDDGAVQVIDFLPVLEGEAFGPLRDERMFDMVQIDPEARTLVWPNGADFDPETLHDWPRYAAAMRHMARAWSATPAKAMS